MTNFEFYQEELQKAGSIFAVEKATGEVKTCIKVICENCRFFGKDITCDKLKMKWLAEPIKTIKTNADKFREVFDLAEEEFNPTNGCSYIKCLCRKCDECPRKNFWFNEYKEPEVREKGVT